MLKDGIKCQELYNAVLPNWLPYTPADKEYGLVRIFCGDYEYYLSAQIVEIIDNENFNLLYPSPEVFGHIFVEHEYFRIGNTVSVQQKRSVDSGGIGIPIKSVGTSIDLDVLHFSYDAGGGYNWAFNPPPPPYIYPHYPYYVTSTGFGALLQNMKVQIIPFAHGL